VHSVHDGPAGLVRCLSDARQRMAGVVGRGACQCVGVVGRLVVITGLPGSGKTTLAVELAASMPAVRMCPDDWMIAAGIDLWNDAVRSRIEEFQLTLTLVLLRSSSNVIVEWGVWTRDERDALRAAGRAIRAPVELRCVSAPMDELWRRIESRDREGRWGSRSITREDLERWATVYEPPDADEIAQYDRAQDRDDEHRRDRQP
jgi:predicted kinase